MSFTSIPLIHFLSLFSFLLVLSFVLSFPPLPFLLISFLSVTFIHYIHFLSSLSSCFRHVLYFHSFNSLPSPPPISFPFSIASLSSPLPECLATMSFTSIPSLPSSPLVSFPFSIAPPLPECLADHVLVRDAVVGEGLAPDGVECVVQGLGSQFIGLKDKRRRRIEHLRPSRRSSSLLAVAQWPLIPRASSCIEPLPELYKTHKAAPPRLEMCRE